MHILHFQGGPTKYGLHPHFYRKIFIVSPLWFFKNLNSPINKYERGEGCIVCRGVKSLNILSEWPSGLKFYSWGQNVCVYTHTHTHTHTHTRTHKDTHAQTHTHTKTHMHKECVRVCFCVCVWGQKNWWVASYFFIIIFLCKKHMEHWNHLDHINWQRRCKSLTFSLFRGQIQDAVPKETWNLLKHNFRKYKHS